MKVRHMIGLGKQGFGTVTTGNPFGATCRGHLRRRPRTSAGLGGVGRAIAALAAAGALGVAVRAAPAATVTYADFPASGASALALNGYAKVGVTTTAGDADALQLTPTGGSYVYGTAFSQAPLLASGGFSTEFQFRMTDPAGTSDGTAVGADGLTFTVQNVSASAGGAGGGIGYLGIGHSAAVKFDTYQNAALHDPSSNYLGVATDGDLDNADYPGGQVKVAPDFDNGTVWTAWVDYDGRTASVYAVDSAAAAKPAVPLLTWPVDLGSVTGSQSDYVGFTAAGGTASENTYVLNWTYYDYYNPSLPEPAMTPVLAAIGGALGLRRRRRR